MKASHTKAAVFTLMELLAVSGATMMAAVGRGGGKGRTMQCLANVRRLALASQMYVNDHNDYLPPPPGGSSPFACNIATYLGIELDACRAEDWVYLIDLYRSNPVFRCPAWPRPRDQYDYGLQYTANNFDFTIGTGIPRDPRGTKLSIVPQPHSGVAHIVELNAEGAFDFVHYDIFRPDHTTFSLSGAPNPPFSSIRMISAGDRCHDGYTTLSFMDSHAEVRALPKEELPFKLFNPLAPGSSP